MKYSIERFGATRNFDSLQEMQKVIKDLRLQALTTGKAIKVSIQITPPNLK